MKQVGRINPQGQLYLPREIRDVLGFQKGDRVKFILKDGVLEVRPHKNKISLLAGKYKGVLNLEGTDVNNIREKIDYSAL